MKKILPLIILFFIALIPVVPPVFSEDDDSTVYVIREVDFNVIGRTRPYYLIMYGDFTKGERIQGEVNLERYLARKVQLLNNQRVLDNEATRIEYFPGAPEPDGAIPLRLLVHVEDTMNFIILPYPKYDDNDGFSFTLKARDYNFLGTMSPLRIDLGYKYDINKKHSFNFVFDSDTPFQAFDLDWNFNFDHTFNYTLGERLYYQNVTGLSFRLPWQSTAFTIGFNHYLTFNEKIDDANKPFYNNTKDYYDPYGSSELFAYWGIPLGIPVGSFGWLYYTPGLSGRISYPYYSMDDPHKPVTTFSQTIGFGSVDWIGNFRRGLTAYIGNWNSWYFDRSDAPLNISLDANAAFYWPFNQIFGITARLRYRQWWQWSDKNDKWLPYSSAGDVIRGVLNSDIKAFNMLSLNLDFPVRVLRFWPSEWFDKSRLRYFNFEMFFSPFLDLALLEGPYSKLKNQYNPTLEGTRFDFGDLISTTGLEVTVYPAIFRSFYIRGSLGYDINKIRNRGLPLKWGFFPQWDEIYIGVDLYY